MYSVKYIIISYTLITDKSVLNFFILPHDVPPRLGTYQYQLFHY